MFICLNDLALRRLAGRIRVGAAAQSELFASPGLLRHAGDGIRQRGDFVGAHRVLTAAAGMAGQNDVAKTALQELRRAQSNISLAWIERQMPIKQDADREHYLEGFRRAGLE
jgi:hypothetical protein